jgi:hypothetical protein
VPRRAYLDEEAVGLAELALAGSLVACLRSPSRALREVRIFSARCFGV